MTGLSVAVFALMLVSVSMARSEYFSWPPIQRIPPS